MPLISMNHSDVIKYWFSEKSRQHWFSSTPEIDNEIKSIKIEIQHNTILKVVLQYESN